MNNTTRNTQQNILLDMFNEIALGDLDLDKLEDEDIIEFSDYFMDHVNMPSVYKDELPLSKKIMPIYDALSSDDREEFNNIIFENSDYRNEFFYDSPNLEITEEEAYKMTDEEVTAYLKEHDGIFNKHIYSEAEEKLLSKIIDLFSMIIEETEPYNLDKTTKEEYLDNAKRQFEHFINI